MNAILQAITTVLPMPYARILSALTDALVKAVMKETVGYVAIKTSVTRMGFVVLMKFAKILMGAILVIPQQPHQQEPHQHARQHADQQANLYNPRHLPHVQLHTQHPTRHPIQLHTLRIVLPLIQLLNPLSQPNAAMTVEMGSFKLWNLLSRRNDVFGWQLDLKNSPSTATPIMCLALTICAKKPVKSVPMTVMIPRAHSRTLMMELRPIALAHGLSFEKRLLRRSALEVKLLMM
mmetsp:Transcript_26570/g.39300  ORF Transcript_26570/g.39300 Transcript_26570/m.39300 type:complete len:235 (+) Transcript_26570:757-1461(+)